jgi:PST family polysaccharide transporter
MRAAQVSAIEPERTVAPGGALWPAFARGVRDNFVAEFVVQAVRVGGMVLLTRALRPEDFGLLTILLVVSAIANLTNEAGIPDALIQRKEVTPAHESTAWCLCTALALATAAILYVTAPTIAGLMAMPGLRVGVRLLCIPLMLEGTAAAAGARLRRRLHFGVLAAADVMAEIGFLATALGMLWVRQPMLSLPAALAARYALHAMVIWIAEPLLPRVLPTRGAARDFARFASTVWSGRLIYALSSNADYVLVGRILGSRLLGFYSIAWTLLRFVPDRLHRVAGRVALPAFCQLEHDRTGLALAYRDFYDYVARVILPFAACSAIAAPEILGTIYGAKWIPAALPMRLLAPGLALCGLRLGIGPVYYAKDHPSFDIYLHGARLLLLMVAVIGLAPWQLFGVSAGMSVVEGIISIVGIGAACVLAEVTLREIAQATIPALRLTLVCGIATIAGRSLALAAGADRPIVTIAAVVPAVLVYAWMEGATVLGMIGTALRPKPISAATASSAAELDSELG